MRDTVRREDARIEEKGDARVGEPGRGNEHVLVHRANGADRGRALSPAPTTRCKILRSPAASAQHSSRDICLMGYPFLAHARDWATNGIHRWPDLAMAGVTPFPVMTEKYAAFFDASGKPSPGNVLFVSGFASTEKNWLRFEEQWNTLMRKWGIEKPFHTTHYARGEGSNYERFRNNDAERIAFEGEAISVIKRNTNKPFSFGIAIDDYNEAHRQYAFSPGFNRPYALAGYAAVSLLIRWVQRQRAAGDILAWRHARLLRRRGLVEKGHACFAGLFKQLPHDSCQCLGTKETFELAQRFGKPKG
jgi:hypothetical protein